MDLPSFKYITGEKKVTYTILPDPVITDIFEISFLSGIIQINKPPDYEITTFYQFTVEASDNDGLEATASVVVYVLDANDNQPVFVDTTASISVPESISSSRIIHTVKATDRDSEKNGYGYVTYQISAGNTNGVFNVNPHSGRKIICIYHYTYDSKNLFLLR